jgi:hypothetical protein
MTESLTSVSVDGDRIGPRDNLTRSRRRNLFQGEQRPNTSAKSVYVYRKRTRTKGFASLIQRLAGCQPLFQSGRLVEVRRNVNNRQL